MPFYEVIPADTSYRGAKPLVYSYTESLPNLSVVTIPLRRRMVSGFVVGKVKSPTFATKAIKSLMSQQPLPAHCLELARWLASYYHCSFGEALRQFAPSKPAIRTVKTSEEISLTTSPEPQLKLDTPLTDDQSKALAKIQTIPSTTILLHGETGSGKTRVYIELAKAALDSGQSVILLTPEIALTSQLATAVDNQLHSPTYILHSQLPVAKRKKIWLSILQSNEPVVIIGPRSALFSPVKNLGLIIVDEAHETAYKQEQSPRYHAVRAASQLGNLTGARVVLGTATPALTDYFLAKQRRAIARMKKMAVGSKHLEVGSDLVDLKDRTQLTQNPHLSNQLIDDMKKTLADGRQILLYLNRRGSARLVLCNNCGWQLLCPNCDIPLVYHGDRHEVRCHICGHKEAPPLACPSCSNHDVIYKSIGTKALAEAVTKLFPQSSVQRFDSDNLAGERVNELYSQLRDGKINILVGTQLLAKGFDLPRLGLVGIVSAETSLALPDFTAEERSFQLLYQVIGRVGRGHGRGKVVVQSYNPDNVVIKAAVARDWESFYNHILSERQQFRFPPFSYLLKLVCRRASSVSAESAAVNLKKRLQEAKLPVEIIGPAPNFYARRGRYFYWQIVVKSKNRAHLLELADLVPQDWAIDLDPIDLL